MGILFDGKANLEELFAELASAHLDATEGVQAESDRILPGSRILMKLPAPPDQVFQSLGNHPKEVKSN